MPDTFTPEQISQILEEFFRVVGTRQYIGARYVPIFGRKGEESIEWDNTAPYEPLTIVLHQGNSYTSRQFVPVGVEITNQEFWAITGNYNAQVEMYRRETAAAREVADNALTAANNAQTDIDTLLPKADFSAENTIKDYVDAARAVAEAAQNDIDTLLPKTDFSAENTVKDYVDAIATNAALTIGDNFSPAHSISDFEDETNATLDGFDADNTVKDYIDTVNSYRDTNMTVSMEQLTLLGELEQDWEGVHYIPQSIHYSDNILYVGFASGDRVHCRLHAYNATTLELIRSRQISELYCHFNCLSEYSGSLYTISPETTSYNGVTGSYLVKFNKETFALESATLIDTTARCDNMIFGANKYDSGATPVVQSYNTAQHAFIDYGSIATDSGTLFMAISSCEYMRRNGGIADGCVLDTNWTGNIRNIFAYICSRIVQADYMTKLNSILLVQPNGWMLPEIILPKEITEELEGISTDNNGTMYFNTVSGKVYKFNYSISDLTIYYPNSNVRGYLSRWLTSASPIFEKLGISYLSNTSENTGYMLRRFPVSNYGYGKIPENALGLALGQLGVSQPNDNLDTLDFIGIGQRASAQAFFIRLRYVTSKNAANNCKMAELSQIRMVSMHDATKVSQRDNVQAVSDTELSSWLSNVSIAAEFLPRVGTKLNGSTNAEKYYAFIVED